MSIRIGKIYGFILAASIILASTAFASQKQPDVRILVDVSGSMKKNDPKNLRIPAVRLVTGILPKGSKAGVWLFAENVESLSAISTVTSNSKKRINNLASKIHNRGLFTNIGTALEVATQDWTDADDSTQRIVILLTDGVVDISKDVAKNRAERARIQKQLIPQLKQLDARIYTIALSDEADGELLAQLSNSTDAWFESVKTASELEKVFLKIFEQSVNVPTLPITNNKFKIDRSIDEFTALVFRNSLDPITLISPDGKHYEADTIGSNITWFEENKFDLITIRKPEAGIWKIEGPVDPSNRVMVVSDLALDVNNDELPTNLLSGESLHLKVSLQEKGNVINRASFLKLIHFSGEVNTTSTEIDSELILEDSGENGDLKKADGIFGYQFKAPKIDEEVTFELSVKSPTFERVFRRSVRIFSSYVKYNTTVAETLEQFHKIEITPLSTVVNSDSLNVSGVLTIPDGSEIELEFTKKDNGNWQTEIVADNLGGTYSAILQINGEVLSGKTFKLENEKINFQAIPFETKKVEENPTEEIKEETAEIAKEEAKTEAEENQETETSDKEKKSEAEGEEAPSEEILSTMWWIIIGVGFNLIMFGGGFFFWKRWKKKQTAAGDELADALDDDEDKSSKDTS